MKKLYALSRQTNPKFALAAIISGISLAMSVGLLGTSAWLISMASMQPPVLVLEVAIVSVRFFGLARGFFRYFARIQEHSAVLRLQSKLRSSLYQTFESHLPATFFGVSRGTLLNTMVSDTETVLDIWIRILSPWISALVAGVCGVGIIYLLVPVAGVVIGLIFIVVMTLIPWIAYATSENEAKSDLQESLTASLVNAFDSMPESILFNKTETVSAKVHEIQNSLNSLEKRSSISAGLGDFLVTAATGTSIIFALYSASHAFINHTLSGVNVAVVSLLPLAIFDGIALLPAAFSQLPALKVSAERLAHQVSLDQGVGESPVHDLHAISATLELRNFLPEHLRGRIAPLSTVIQPGKPLVITGKSGTGKSSIVHGLAGLTPSVGEIVINGKLVNSVTPEFVTIGLQDDHLFQSSIKENLRIAREGVTDREIMQMLEVVELAELIHSLPDGIDTHIGPYGHNFSGGERQRLKLARVLLRHTPIFILDEPFEFLDPLQAKRIAHKVEVILAEKTVLIISHLPLGSENVLHLGD